MLTSGIPSTSGSLAPGPKHLEQPWHHVDVHVQSRERAHPRQHVADRFCLENATITRSHGELANDRCQVVDRADDRDTGDIGPPPLGRRVHEPDQLDAVLRVAQQFPRNELPDVAGPDDDSALSDAITSPRERTPGHTSGGEECHGGHRKHENAVGARGPMRGRKRPATPR